jgi:hypothetical protein
MLIEYRSYVLVPGKLGAFLQLMESEGIRIEEPVLGKLLGFFTSEIGELNKVVHMWAYESFEERQRRRALLAASPTWQAFTPKVLPLIQHMENELLVPTSFSPPIPL